MPTVHYSHKEDRYWVRDGDDIVWFDGPLEAQHGALAIDRKHAILAEVKLIAERQLRSDRRRHVGIITYGEAIEQ